MDFAGKVPVVVTGKGVCAVRGGKKAAVGHGKTSLGPPQRGPGRAREQNAQGRFRGISQAAGGGRFFRLAALEIENEENEEFWKAQDRPDPPPEVMERLHAHLQADMRRAGRKTRRRRVLKQLAQMAACLAIVCCVGFTGVYLTVDAARTAINNFVLEMFDGLCGRADG